MILTPNNPALAQAITIHPKSKRSPTETTILKSVSDNKKMGKGSNLITKGKWSGMPMFQMSLEERATCSRDCQQWASCFANNMAFAHRIDHTHPEFIPTLDAELSALCHLYRHGVVVRPHVIGDYFSAEYAQWWMDQVERHKNLHLFGFTHWARSSDIGKIISHANESDRVWIRFSDQGGEMSANVAGGAFDNDGFQCPEQVGKTNSCLTCAACWGTLRAVRFKHH